MLLPVEASQAWGQEPPGPRGNRVSPKMAWLFPKDELLAFQEQGRGLQCPAGTNRGEASSVRAWKSSQPGLSPRLFLGSSPDTPHHLLRLSSPFWKMRILTSSKRITLSSMQMGAGTTDEPREERLSPGGPRHSSAPGRLLGLLWPL